MSEDGSILNEIFLSSRLCPGSHTQCEQEILGSQGASLAVTSKNHRDFFPENLSLFTLVHEKPRAEHWANQSNVWMQSVALPVDTQGGSFHGRS